MSGVNQTFPGSLIDQNIHMMMIRPSSHDQHTTCMIWTICGQRDRHREADSVVENVENLIKFVLLVRVSSALKLKHNEQYFLPHRTHSKILRIISSSNVQIFKFIKQMRFGGSESFNTHVINMSHCSVLQLDYQHKLSSYC